jgi:hypothetical protein
MLGKTAFARSKAFVVAVAVECGIASVLAAPGRFGAQEFLRGDANSDGQASGSDAHAILGYLFIGLLPPRCLRSGDVDANNAINLTDAIRLLNFLVLGGPAPCRPFPEPGEDPSSELSCGLYLPEPPVEDPRFVLEVSDAIAGADGTTTVTLFLTNPTESAGYFGRLVVDGARFGGVRDVTDLSGTFATGFAGAQAFGGEIRFGFLSSIVGGASIAPGEGLPGLQIECCLEGGLTAGDYEITVERAEFAELGTGRAVPPAVVQGNLSVPDDLPAGAGCLSQAEPDETPQCGPPDTPPSPCPPDEPALDFVRGDINLDGRVSLADSLRLRETLSIGGPPLPCNDAADANDDGRIGVTDIVFLLSHLHLGGREPAAPFPEPGPDPTPEDCFRCASQEIVPAEASDEVLRLGEIEAFRGATVRIPVLLSNTVDIDSFQLVFRTDPGVLVPLDDQRPLAFDGSFGASIDGGGAGFRALREVSGETDTFVAAWVPHLSEPGFEVPPGEDRIVFFVRMRLSADTQPGSEVVLELTDGPDGAGFEPLGLRNELTSHGTARFPRLVSGVIRVLEGESILRGDSNHDGRLNLTDSLFTLNWLFLGAPQPPCLDEADVDDDGTVNISDPIGLLAFLFLGASPPRPPFPEVGVDPSEDGLPQCFGELE